eukprot:931406-Heterocapsa_arctica.AAC.1
MGWSWALYFCNESLSHCCREAQESLGLDPRLVCDLAPPPRLRSGGAVCAPYVNNGNVLGVDADSTKVLLTTLVDKLEATGFVVRDR